MTVFAWEKREPQFNQLDYNSSIIKYLSFFNSEVSNGDRRKLALEYWKSKGLDVSGMGRLPDFKFQQLGVLARITSRGYSLEPKHQEMLDGAYDTLSKVTDTEEEKPVVKRRSTEETHHDEFLDICETFDGELERISSSEKRTIDVKRFYVKRDTHYAICKMVSDHFLSRREELAAAIAGDDEQLVEGYSHLSKKAMKMMLEFMSEITASEEANKKIRKPRKKKVKTAAELVSKVQYMPEFDSLGMVSVEPSKIIGSEVVYLFNTKLRKLFFYIAVKGETLTIKGTTIIGFDPVKSGGKNVRKPEVFFSPLSGYETMSRREFLKAFDSIRAKVIEGPGRISKDMVIVKVY